METLLIYYVTTLTILSLSQLCWSHPCNDSSLRFDFSSENVPLVTTLDRWEEKLSEASRDGKLVVANFSAAWCMPCRAIAPVYSELAVKYSSTTIFLTVDVDELPELSTSWDVKATPTFFFLRDGKQVDRLVGANKLELLKKTAVFSGFRQRESP